MDRVVFLIEAQAISKMRDRGRELGEYCGCNGWGDYCELLLLCGGLGQDV